MTLVAYRIARLERLVCILAKKIGPAGMPDKAIELYQELMHDRLPLDKTFVDLAAETREDPDPED